MNENELFDAVRDAIIDVELGRVHIVDGIDTIMALVTPQWTPVTPETLPPHGVDILLVYNSGGRKFVVEGRQYLNGFYFVDGGFASGKEITHWQPLPDPPKETHE
jgi:hypothetical protein